MKKLVYINACIRREESRTKRIADALLPLLGEGYAVDEIDLTDSPLLALSCDRYNRRQAGQGDPLAEDYARRVADADLILVAMPFWDMSFPSVFKVFCEAISLEGITFKVSPEGGFTGGCRADRLLLVTTRGMEIEDGSPLEQGSSYLKALGFLWGIPEVLTVSAIGMDAVDDETREQRITDAIARGKALCETL